MSDRIAPYPETDYAETRSINIFENLISDRGVKVYINTRDKIPNIDGYIELVNDKNKPFAKLDVQIKKLPDKFDPKKPKIRIPLGLYDYSKVTATPTLFIGVDINREIAYWIYIHDNLKNSKNIPLVKLNQETTTISLKLDNINDGRLDGNNKDFLARWIEITKDHCTRISEFPEIKEENDELKKKLQKFTHSSIGIIDPEFYYIHIFLDEINNSLNTFKVVKERYYPSTWKLGIMYHEFSDSVIVYALYSIMYTENDIQIKKIDNSQKIIEEGLGFAELSNDPNKRMDYIRQKFMEEGLGFVIQSVDPIKNNPKRSALKRIKPKLEEMLKVKGLMIKNEFLAKEFSYAFVNRFYSQLGLSKKDKYSIKEISTAYANVNVNTLHNNELPLFLFPECLKFLKENKIKYLEIVYLPKDYSRLVDNSWIWNTLTRDEVMNNLKIFFDNLPSAYEDIISANFPELKNELNELSNVSRLIVVANLKEKYERYEDRPLLNIYYLIGKEHNDLKIEFYQIEDNNIPDIILNDLLRKNFDEVRNGFNEGFELDGHHYKFKMIRHMLLDFIYDDTPILTYIYGEFKSKFGNYFNQKL